MSAMSSKTEELIQALSDLGDLRYGEPKIARASHTKIEAVLNLIFVIGRKKMIFTEDQRRIIGPLLSDAIRPIKINIERVALSYRTSLEPSVLQKRSSLQFLIEDFGDLPVEEGTTLSDKLAASNIQESITLLDGIIRDWRDVSDSDETSSTIPKYVDLPKSHTWWLS